MAASTPLGLTSAEAIARRPRRRPARRARGSRSYANIVRNNVFTLFNAILGVLLAVILALGDYRDGLFGGVMIANIAIGIIQEVRAKRALDRLALLVAPHGRTWRDGELARLPVEELVLGDVIRLEPGDQVIADGQLVAARALSLDESMLTGESEAVNRAVGEKILSGVFCTAGSADYVVEAIGADSYAERLAAEARSTSAPLSPLQLDVNRILRITVMVMVPLAVLLVTSLALRDTSIREAGRTAVAGLLPLVPEGLVLLTSLTFAVAAVRLARLGTLAQRINAIESLASVDVVCLDKTGTLTDNRLRLVALEPAVEGGEPGLRADIALLAASAAARNGTLQAIHDAEPAEAATVSAEVPFSSERKWSGLTLDGHDTLVLGAPDVLASHGVALSGSLGERIAQHAANRRRVVLLAASPERLEDDRLPPGLVARGIAVLEEGLREEAIDTIAFLVREGVEIKIISGDGLATVQAVALAAGVPHAERGIAGPDLPDDLDALAEVVQRHTVFARVRPDQKRALVQALTGSGRYVAMVGDGVNDVLALKEARLAIAMGNGSQMAKGVADLVLLTNAFSTVPRAIEEGRRILRNTHRVARLFVTKSVYSAFLVATLAIAPIAYPFLPRHLTIVSTLTVGLPAFFLALASSEGPVRSEGFLRDVARFAVPVGAVVATVIAAAYLLARGPFDRTLLEARTITVGVTVIMGLAVVVAVERDGRQGRVRGWVWVIVGVAAAVAICGVSVPWLRSFFELAEPDAADWLLIASVGGCGVVLLALVRRAVAVFGKAAGEGSGARR